MASRSSSFSLRTLQNVFAVKGHRRTSRLFHFAGIGMTCKPTPSSCHLASIPSYFSSTSRWSSSLAQQQQQQQQQQGRSSTPPNLKIDPRSKFSLLKRAAAVVQDTVVENDDEDDRVSTGEPEQLQKDSKMEGNMENTPLEEDDDDDYDVDEEIDDELDWEHALRNNQNTVRHVVPLPDRLHTSVYDKTDASVVGSLYLNEQVFGHDDIRIDLLQRAVEHHRACVRGKRNAITKTIGQVSGSGRKVRKQKGSGQARAGHSRPAHWRGGAKAHGPKGNIQDYGARKLNKKVRRLALTHALSQKLKEGNIIVVNDWDLVSHKTKELAQLLRRWNIGGRNGASAFMLDHVDVDDEQEQETDEAPTSVGGLPVRLVVATGNMHSVQVAHQLFANTYSILKHEKLVLTVSAVQALEERLVN